MVRDDTDRRQALTRELVGLQATSSWQERGAAVALQLQEIEKRWSLCWTDDRNALRYPRPWHADSAAGQTRKSYPAIASTYYYSAGAIARLTWSSSAVLILASNSLSESVERVVD
jgi:hypothetical protein